MARSSDSTAIPRSTSCSSKWAYRLTSLPPSSVRLTPPFSVHGAASLNLAPCGGDWADSRRDCMKAIRLLEYGGQLVLNDIPTPTIARDEILVKIKSTAVNHLDLVKASGAARQILPIDLPWIPGHEFSGVVEQFTLELPGSEAYLVLRRQKPRSCISAQVPQRNSLNS